MKSFGIAMIILGAFLAVMGLYFSFTVKDTSSWTCIADTGAQSSTCSFQSGSDDASDPGQAQRTTSGALALCIVGAGVFAGGMAAAAGASHPVRRPPAGPGFPPPPGAPYPPAGGNPPPSSAGYGQPPQR